MTQTNNPLEELFEQTECAVGVQKRGDNCFTDKNAKKIIEHFKEKDIKDVSKDNLLETLKKETKCTDDKCVNDSTELAKIIGDTEVHNHKTYQMKPNGPKDDPTKWLSNHNIDGILEQLTKTFKKDNNFYYIKFHMSDFNNDTELATIDLFAKYNEGMRTFAVVLNDDVSTGGGTHWTAIFCDFRNEKIVTIEHFNSAGAGIMPSFNTWMTDTKTKLGLNLPDFDIKLVYADNIEHQKDNASCGPYSLYYIISRLKGISYEVFMDQQNTIKDEVMWEFRKVLFD